MAGKIQNADIKSLGELTTLGASKVQLPNTDKMYTPKSDEVLETTLRKNNDAAITDPDENVDSSQNYEVGSRWINTATGKIFFCVDNTAGAAIWKQSGSGGSGKLNFITIGTQEDAALSDYETGQGTEFKESVSALGGALSLTDDTESFRGDVSLKYTANATASNSDGDWVSRTTLIPRGYQRESLLDFAFEFSNQFAEGNAKILMIDSNGKELVNENLPNHVPTNEEAQNFTRRIVLDDGVTSVDWGIFIVNGESSAEIKLDDVVLTPEIGFSEQTVLDTEVDSMVRVQGGDGPSGSQTLTFATLSDTIGEAISYDAGTGEFTAQKSGIYHASVTDESNATDAELAVRVNGTSRQQAQTYNALRRQAVSWSGYLNQGDVITFFSSNTRGAAGARSATVAKIGSVSQFPTTVNQKINIPISQARMEQSNSRGSSATDVIKYDNIEKLIGEGILITSNSSEGTRFTIQKEGVLFISASAYFATNAVLKITRNQSNLSTGLSIPVSEVLATDGAQGANEVAGVSWSGKVNVGDQIRIVSNVSPNNSDPSHNTVDLIFQEQEVSVNVNTITPQFEDEDTSIRLKDFVSLTSNKIKLNSVIQNRGNAAEYDSSDDAFVIKESGTYNISASGVPNSNGISIGIAKNETSFLYNSNMLAFSESSNNFDQVSCSWQGYLEEGDSIYFLQNGASANNADRYYFGISKQANPSIVGIDGRPIDAYIEEADSNIILDGLVSPNGFGTATDNKTVTFLNQRQFKGSAFSYSHDLVNGDSWTVNEPGLYFIHSGIRCSVQGQELLIMKNCPDRTEFASVLATNNPELILGGSLGNSGFGLTQVHTVAQLEKGDVITLQAQGSALDASSYQQQNTFSMGKVGALKRKIPVSDQTIDIPTSEVILRDPTGNGGVNNGILQFSTVSKIEGEALSFDNTDGTFITVQKEGVLHISVSLERDNASDMAIYKNPTVTTGGVTDPNKKDQTIVASTNATNWAENMSWSGKVVPGDIICVGADVGNIVGQSNILTAVHQETKTQISLSNVEPQFEDIDFGIRLVGANGYGSSGTKIRRFNKIVQKNGDKVKYVDSSTNGASFEILESGIYNLSYVDQHSGSGGYFGISLNSSDLTSDIWQIDQEYRLTIESVNGNDGNDYQSTSWTGYLQKGDIVRPHTNGALNGSFISSFTIAKVGKPSFAAVDISKFMDIDINERQVIGTNSPTGFSTAGTNPKDVEFTSLNIEGDNLLTPIVSGGITLFTANKTCYIDAAFSALLSGASNSYVVILVNGVEKINGSLSGTSGNWNHVSGPIKLQKGDSFSFRTWGTSHVVNQIRLSIKAVAESEGTISETQDLFDSDSADLTFSSTPLNGSEKVGTYNIYDYNASSNTAVIRGSQHQTKAEINRNGFELIGRAYNQGALASPARVDIQIGKGHKAVEFFGYSGPGKAGNVSIDFTNVGSNAYGCEKSYNENTGILTISSGVAATSTNTLRRFGTDILSGSTALTGNIVVKASRKLPMAVINKQVTKWQKKFLSSNYSGGTTNLTELQFNNLEIGKTYRASLQGFFGQTASTSGARMYFRHSGQDIANVTYDSSSSGSGGAISVGTSVIFVATSTTLFLEANASGGTPIIGNGTGEGTFTMLEELPLHEETTQWN